MVSLRLGLVAHCARRAAASAATLIVVAACRPGETGAGAASVEDTSAAGNAVQTVRRHYGSRDMAAAGAWTWAGSDGTVFVLIDAQSTVEDLVQARADLWLVADTAALQIGRSDVMPSAAEFGAYAFQDLTGDGIPDLFGYVADSAGVSYPVFLVGTRGGMTEEIATAAPGWRFATGEDQLPQVVSSPAGTCALQLWAEDPAPDGQPAGWRYLTVQRGGALGGPQIQPPACGVSPAGVQPGAGVP